MGCLPLLAVALDADDPREADAALAPPLLLEDRPPLFVPDDDFLGVVAIPFPLTIFLCTPPPAGPGPPGGS